MWFRSLCLLCVLSISIDGEGGSTKKRRDSLSEFNLHREHFWSIDPYCLESLASYFLLYHNAPSQQRLQALFPNLTIDDLKILSNSMISSKQPDYTFSQDEMDVFKKVSSPGLRLLSNQDFCFASPEDDLATALITAEFAGAAVDKAVYYCCFLDLMALRIHVERMRYLDEFPCLPDSEEFHRYTIEAMNKILFFEEGVRFPSKREMLSDEFSLLSSVTDKKFGVCLGIASLYFSLSQRLSLPLEAITPPGHIYLTYKQGLINIETTAGGRHIPTEHYTDCISNDELRTRTPKEFIALTFMNQGSFALQKRDYQMADQAYERAKLYFEDENELQELRGIVKILNGNLEEGEALLKSSPQSSIVGTPSYDYLHGHVDQQTLALLFVSPGESYQAMSDYYQQLKESAEKSKHCCECWRRLASVALYLGKTSEGIYFLEKCLLDTPDDIFLHLKLCYIFCDRYDFVQAAYYFRLANLLVDSHPEKDRIINSSLYKNLNQKLFLTNF